MVAKKKRGAKPKYKYRTEAEALAMRYTAYLTTERKSESTSKFYPIYDTAGASAIATRQYHPTTDAKHTLSSFSRRCLGSASLTAIDILCMRKVFMRSSSLLKQVYCCRLSICRQSKRP